MQAARNEIEKLKLNEMTAREAVKEVAKILHKVWQLCRLPQVHQGGQIAHKRGKGDRDGCVMMGVTL